MSNIPTLVFIRHGETDWNRDGRLQGQVDIPINERGRRQAHRNGEVLAREMADIGSFDFVASPLSRTRETMEIARAAMGLSREDYHLDDRLKEITFGDWEGFTIPEVEAKEPEAVAARAADKWRFSPPGGESYMGLADRVIPWLLELDRPTVVVAHGGIGRVLRIRLLGDEPLPAMSVNIAQDRVLIWQDGEGRFV
jgi:broad specificity phosphatase PhoE